MPSRTWMCNGLGEKTGCFVCRAAHGCAIGSAKKHDVLYAGSTGSRIAG